MPKKEIPNYENIHTIVFDFDGVFTDNKVLILQDGTEAVFCNRSDGIGLKMLKEMNILTTIISSEKNPLVLIESEMKGATL